MFRNGCGKLLNFYTKACTILFKVKNLIILLNSPLYAPSGFLSVMSRRKTMKIINENKVFFVIQNLGKIREVHNKYLVTVKSGNFVTFFAQKHFFSQNFEKVPHF